MQFSYGTFVIPYRCISFVQLLFMFIYWYICFAYGAVANFLFFALCIVILIATDIVTKLSIFRSKVKPVILHGWTMGGYKDNHKGTEAFINRCCKKMFKIFGITKWRTVEACKRETSGSASQTVAMEVNWTYTKKEFLCHGKQALSWEPQGYHRRERPRKSWRKIIEEEAAIVGKIWRELKAINGKKVHWHCLVETLLFRLEQHEFDWLDQVTLCHCCILDIVRGILGKAVDLQILVCLNKNLISDITYSPK